MLRQTIRVCTESQKLNAETRRRRGKRRRHRRISPVFSAPPRLCVSKEGSSNPIRTFSVHTLRQFARLALLVIATLSLPAAAHASLIAWGSPQNITGDSDVSTVGTLVVAYNLGGAGVASTTVNGVTFFGINGGGNTAGSVAVDPFMGLSAPYQALLSSNTLSGAFVIFGIVSGQDYQIEFWNNISNVSASSNLVLTSGNSVTLSSNTSSAIGGIGQFVLGTFVGDASNFQTVVVGGNQHTNGYQLRAIPEPGSTGLLALGVCVSGLFLRSRRKPSR